MINRQIVEYDLVRVITLCLVVLGHCDYYDIVTDYGGIEPCFSTMGQPIVSQFIYKLTRCIYTFHMPLFMALSGALWFKTINKGKANSLTSVFNNKFKRLIIPMILSAVLWSIPLKYLSGYWDDSGDNIIRDIIYGQLLMFGNFNSHLWFLQALFWCFIMSWILEKVAPPKKNRSTLLFMTYLIITTCIGIKMQQMGLCFLNFTSALQYLLWFYVGFYFESKRLIVNSFLSSHLNILPISFLVFIISWSVSLHVPSIVRPLFYFSNALLGMFSVYNVSYYLSKKAKLAESKLVRLLSVSSLGIYLYSDPLNYPIIKIVNCNESLVQFAASNTGALMLFFFRFIVTFVGALTVEILLNYKKYVKNI